jgi:hypothetical protein
LLPVLSPLLLDLTVCAIKEVQAESLQPNQNVGATAADRVRQVQLTLGVIRQDQNNRNHTLHTPPATTTITTIHTYKRSPTGGRISISTMFAARNLDENAIHVQQTAAAAKPLNQGIKGLAPKTPAKAPLGRNKNDENALKLLGKADGKSVKPDRNAFVTPLNPRARAPLGNKTANAKGLQVPASRGPMQDGRTPASGKPTSPRLKRSKIKVHETLETAHDVLQKDPEQRDIEYMPPREVPLNDDPIDILPHEMNLDVLRGANLTTGCWSEYTQQFKDDDNSDLSDFEEKCKKARVNGKQRETKSSIPAAKASLAGTVTSVRSRPPPATIRAKHAASVLSSRATSKALAPKSFGPPLAKARFTSSSNATDARKAVPNSGNRFVATKPASRNTIGYSKGRAVSASARASTSEPHSRPKTTTVPPQQKSTLNDLLKLSVLDSPEDDGLLTLNKSHDAFAAIVDDEESEEGIFQLDPVQDV